MPVASPPSCPARSCATASDSHPLVPTLCVGTGARPLCGPSTGRLPAPASLPAATRSVASVRSHAERGNEEREESADSTLVEAVIIPTEQGGGTPISIRLLPDAAAFLTHGAVAVPRSPVCLRPTRKPCCTATARAAAVRAATGSPAPKGARQASGRGSPGYGLFLILGTPRADVVSNPGARSTCGALPGFAGGARAMPECVRR